jgi:uncharacterized protein YjiS (DUF1127 family)
MRKTKAGARNDALPVKPNRRYGSAANSNHAIWSGSMSTFADRITSVPRFRPNPRASTDYQYNSCSQLDPVSRTLQRWADRISQRAALADLADNKRLLDDIGLTREQALHESSEPFWR